VPSRSGAGFLLSRSYRRLLSLGRGASVWGGVGGGVGPFASRAFSILGPRRALPGIFVGSSWANRHHLVVHMFRYANEPVQRHCRRGGHASATGRVVPHLRSGRVDEVSCHLPIKVRDELGFRAVGSICRVTWRPPLGLTAVGARNELTRFGSKRSGADVFRRGGAHTVKIRACVSPAHCVLRHPRRALFDDELFIFFFASLLLCAGGPKRAHRVISNSPTLPRSGQKRRMFGLPLVTCFERTPAFHLLSSHTSAERLRP